MPCYDSRQAEHYSSQEVKSLESMLCGICSRVEKQQGGKLFIQDDPTLQAWWNAHKEKDQRREAHNAQQSVRQFLIDKAKEKLTPEEQEALGIR